MTTGVLLLVELELESVGRRSVNLTTAYMSPGMGIWNGGLRTTSVKYIIKVSRVY